MEVFVIFCFLFHVTFSAQTPFPVCEPEKSDELYEDTLIIFVAEHHLQLSIQEPHWYYLKQLACTIPRSSFIKTLVIDTHTINSDFTIEEDSFYDSQKMIDELFDLYDREVHSTGRCRFDLDEVIAASPFVKNHRNVHFVVPHFEYPCGYKDTGDKNRVSIVMMSNENKTWRYYNQRGDGLFNTGAKFATKEMANNAKELVELMLNFNRPKIVEECPECDCSESDKCVLKWSIGASVLLVSFAYLGVIVKWVRS